MTDVRVISYGAAWSVPLLVCAAIYTLAAFVLYDVAGPAALTGSATVAVAAYLLFARTTATAEADGVELLVLLEGRRFLPYDEIVEVVFAGKAVHVIMTSGERISVAKNAVLDGSRLESFAQRIREGALAHPRVVDPTIGALFRGKREISEWLRDLRRAFAPGIGGYRNSAPTSDALWRVLEDPNADASARAAAGVALGSTMEPAQRTRIAAIASTVTSPRLRIALQTIGAGTDGDEALAEMLEDVEIESARAAR